MTSAPPARPDLRDLTREEIRALLVSLGEKPYRGDQVFRWVHARGVADAEAMTDLGRELRARLAAATASRGLVVDAVDVSRDGTRKLRLATADGRLIESVLIPDGDAAAPDDGGRASGAADDEEDDDHELAEAGAAVVEAGARGLFPRRPKLTLCISSQVGCALDCRFCATATLGFGRQLRAGEIVEQVHRARAIVAALPPDDPTRRAGADHLTNIVFMGMGEPLHNFAEVARALALLTDGEGLRLSPRRITVSTAGLVPGIAKFAALPSALRPNLAVSLNATTDAVRDEIMPINKKWPIAALLDAVRAVPLERRRRVTFEYVLLDGVNDSPADARRLPHLLRGIPSKVNVIPWNPHPLAPYRRPSEAAVARFQEEAKRAGLAVYVRRPRGDDIAAACGQLAAQKGGELLGVERLGAGARRDGVEG